MWDAENDDDAAFDRRMASVVREIGERGKLVVAESVPPVRAGERAPAPAPAPEPAQALAPAPARAPAVAAAASAVLSSRTSPGPAPSGSPQSTLVPHQSGTEAFRLGTALSVEQQPLATQQVNRSASFGASGTGTSLMEVSAFMTEQLKAQMVEQRAHDNDQHAEVVRLLMERETKLEAQLEAQRKEFEAQRKELMEREAQTRAEKVELEAKLEAQRKELEAKTHAQSRTDKVTALQLRLEVLSESRLLEDEELAAIEDKVADAIGVAGVDDGAESAWDCVMQMIRLSEGIGSEKMFARQLRRKFL